MPQIRDIHPSAYMGPSIHTARAQTKLRARQCSGKWGAGSIQGSESHHKVDEYGSIPEQCDGQDYRNQS